MDYLKEAYGDFAPRRDPDAAAKFALTGLANEQRFDMLRTLLTDGSPTSGVGGEPGWLLERRDAGSTKPNFAGWPAHARYRAYVDPDEFRLAHPEGFYDRGSFALLVRPVLHAAARAFPSRKAELDSLLAMLDVGWSEAPAERLPAL